MKIGPCFIVSALQLATRQGDGRLLRAQLHAVRARQPTRLRTVARQRQLRMGLRDGAALFQEVRGQQKSIHRTEQ